MLEITRQNWKTHRRSFWSRWRHSDSIPLLTEYWNDKLSDFWLYQNRLLRKGKIVWFSVVAANPDLYQPVEQTLPAVVICDVDGNYDENVDGLDTLASELCRRSVHGPPPDDPVSEAVSDDYSRSFGLPVSDAVTGGSRVLLFTLLIHRPHLPAGLLCNTHFPGLYVESCPQVMVLPSHVWAESLIEQWTPACEE